MVEGLVEPIFFPYANTTVGGGCIPGPEEEEQVFYCDVCCEARRQWRSVRKSIEDILKECASWRAKLLGSAGKQGQEA
jgi:hypothetical protein